MNSTNTTKNLIPFLFLILTVSFKVVFKKKSKKYVILGHIRPFCMNENLSSLSLQIYRWVLVFLQYLIPMCVISFVYARIAFKLWGNKIPGNAENTRDAALMKNKKKVPYIPVIFKRNIYCIFF